MSTQTIVLSLGSAASHITQHFYNILQANKDQMQSNEFFSEKRTQTETSVPRSIFVNFQTDIGPTPWTLGEFLQWSEDPQENIELLSTEKSLNQIIQQRQQVSEQIQHQDNIQQHNQELWLTSYQKIIQQRLSQFHQASFIPNDQSVDQQVALFNAWNSGQKYRFIEAPRTNYNLENSLFTAYQEINHPYNYNFKPSTPKLTGQYVKFWDSAAQEDILDLVRHQLEAADRLNGFICFTNGSGRFSGLNGVVCEYLQDEAYKSPILYVDAGVKSQKQQEHLLQRCSQALAHLDTEDNQHIMRVTQDIISGDMYTQMSHLGLVCASLAMQMHIKGYSLDSVQRGLIPVPQRQYLQCNYLIYDAVNDVQQLGFNNNINVLQNLEENARNSVASLSSIYTNPTEIDLNNPEVQFEQNNEYKSQTAQVMAQFAQHQALVPDIIDSINKKGINHYYKEYLHAIQAQSRHLEIKSSGSIPLSETFPHYFDGQIRYRTGANIRVDLLNSDSMQSAVQQLKTDIQTKQRSLISNFFTQCDRDESEVLDYCARVSASYKNAFGMDDFNIDDSGGDSF